MKSVKNFLILALALVSVSAFADAHLRNCMYDYNANLYDFSADGIEEIFPDGRAVVPSILDLKVGDLFIDEDGIVQIVDSITVSSNGDVTINSSMPTNLRSFMDMINIPEQAIEIETEDWEIYGYDSQPELLAQEEAGMTRGAGIASSGGMLGSAIPVSKRDMTPNISVNIPLGGGADPDAIAKAAGASQSEADQAKSRMKNTSGMNLGLNVEVPYKKNKFEIRPNVSLPYTSVFTRKKTWKFWTKEFWSRDNWYTSGYASLSTDIDIYTGIGFEFDVCAKKACEIPICKIPVPVVSAGLYLWPELSLMSSMNIQEYIHYLYKATFTCDLDGEYVLCVPHNFQKRVETDSLYTGTSVTGTIIGTAGIYIGPKIGIEIAGFSLAAISAKVGPEAKATFPVLDFVSYYDPCNEIGEGDYLGKKEFGWSGGLPYIKVLSGSVHKTASNTDALKQSKFEVYAKANVNLSFIKGLISTNVWSWKSSPLFKLPDEASKVKQEA